MAVNGISALAGNTNTSTGSLQRIDKNYQDFLKLLTTQLQNQDPSDPADTTQLTQQIATLTQVEQQLNTNKKLDQLVSLYAATQYNSVVSYIGKEIEAAGNAGGLQDGKCPFVYYLQGDASTLTATIKDEQGSIVYTATGTPDADGKFVWKDKDGNVVDAPSETPDTGRHKFVWNGKGSGGQDMPDGIYKLEISAKDGSNNAIPSQIYTSGIVNAVDSVNGQVYLDVGGLSVPLAGVISIREASTTSAGL